MTSTIIIHVESEPHTTDLSGVMLNRPAPQGGSFLIDRRLDRAIWSEMKAAGAHYMSGDDLEDMDMFDAAPGWRYSSAAIEVLLRHGFTLTVRGQEIATVEAFRAPCSARWPRQPTRSALTTSAAPLRRWSTIAALLLSRSARPKARPMPPGRLST